MKRFAPLFFLVVIVLAITACSPAPQGSLAVQVPQDLAVVIGWFVLIGLTAVAKWIGEKTGVDIQDRAAEIAASVSAVIVLLLNWALGLVPAAYDGFISAVFAFLIVLLPSVGIYSLFLRNKQRA